MVFSVSVSNSISNSISVGQMSRFLGTNVPPFLYNRLVSLHNHPIFAHFLQKEFWAVFPVPNVSHACPKNVRTNVLPFLYNRIIFYTIVLRFEVHSSLPWLLLAFFRFLYTSANKSIQLLAYVFIIPESNTGARGSRSRPYNLIPHVIIYPQWAVWHPLTHHVNIRIYCRVQQYCPSPADAPQSMHPAVTGCHKNYYSSIQLSLCRFNLFLIPFKALFCFFGSFVCKNYIPFFIIVPPRIIFIP